MHRFRGAAAAGALALAAAPLRAQLPSLAPTAVGGVDVEAYYFDDEDATGIKGILLATVPFGARAQLPARVTLEVVGAYAHGVVVDRDDGRSDLEGFTDTQLRLSRTFGRDRLTVGLVGVIPTGHSQHTEEEARVADAVSADLLPFRVTNWGTGGGVGLSLAYAARFAGFGVGASAGYLVAGEFEPFEESDALAYHPGNETTLRVAVDRSVSPSGKAGLQATWQHFSDDRFADQNLYRAGDRLQVLGSYQTALRRSTGVVYAGLLHREHGTSLDEAAPGTPVRDLWLGGAGMRVPLGRRTSLTPSVEGRVFRSEDGQGQGWYGGAGFGLELPLGRVTLLPSLRGRLGKVVVDDEAESRITGVEAGITLRAALP
jgi:hypothetical protein